MSYQSEKELSFQLLRYVATPDGICYFMYHLWIPKHTSLVALPSVWQKQFYSADDMDACH